MGTSYTPVQRNWRWCRNNAIEPTAAQAYEAENTTTTLPSNADLLRLRFDISETGGKNGSPLTAWGLEYSLDDAAWNSFGAAPAHWNYANGLATEGNTSTTFLVTGTAVNGEYFESGTITMALTKNTSEEFDFALQATASVSDSTLYYFRVIEGGTEIPLDAAKTHPNLTTAGATNIVENVIST